MTTTAARVAAGPKDRNIILRIAANLTPEVERLIAGQVMAAAVRLLEWAEAASSPYDLEIRMDALGRQAENAKPQTRKLPHVEGRLGGFVHVPAMTVEAFLEQAGYLYDFLRGGTE